MFRVIVPVPLFFMMYLFPAIPTAVGRVTLNVPVVQSMVLSLGPIA